MSDTQANGAKTIADRFLKDAPVSDTQANGGKTIADRFLKDALDSHRTASIYLTSGFQLKGEIVGFDREAILFNHKNVHQLVMRTAVATMALVPDSTQSTPGWWPLALDEQPGGRAGGPKRGRRT